MELQNLIATCGNWFQSLTRTESGWSAKAMDSTLVGKGETPEEAVTKLITKLQNKGAISND